MHWGQAIMTVSKDLKDAASEAAEELRPDFSQFKAEFDRLSASIGSLRTYLVDLGREGARSAQAAGRAQLGVVRREVGEVSQQVRQHGLDALDQVEEAVR